MPNLPPPPVPEKSDLTSLPYMPLWIARLKRSKSWLLAKRQPEIGFYLINLWSAAWHEVPAGSLEDDDDLLADLAMCAPERWTEVRELVMRGWTKHADGKLYTPFLSDRVNEALAVREAGISRADRMRKGRAEKRAAALKASEMPPDGAEDDGMNSEELSGNSDVALSKEIGQELSQDLCKKNTPGKGGKNDPENADRASGVTNGAPKMNLRMPNKNSDLALSIDLTSVSNRTEVEVEGNLSGEIQASPPESKAGVVSCPAVPPRASPPNGTAGQPREAKAETPRDGFDLDRFGLALCDAAGIDQTRWTGDWRIVSTWLGAGIEPDTILEAVKARVARPGYVAGTVSTLRYFDAPVRQTHAARAEAATAAAQPRPPTLNDDLETWISFAVANGGKASAPDERGKRHGEIGGFYLDAIAELACEASAINGYVGDPGWSDLASWLRSGFDPHAVILPVIREFASRPGYKPPDSFRYFGKTIAKRAASVPR